jgi:hypothetical protein
MYCLENLKEIKAEAKALAELNNTTVLITGRYLNNNSHQTVLGYSIVGHLNKTRDEIVKEEIAIWKKENQRAFYFDFIS